MDKAIGLCNTCATIRDDGKIVYLAKEPIAQHPDVMPLVHGYRWSMAHNLHYTIYLGEGPFNTGALVLVQNSADGPQPRPTMQSQQPADRGGSGAAYVVDDILRELGEAGPKLRDALIESGVLDDAAPKKFEKRRKKVPQPEPGERDVQQTEAETQSIVLVARKINALDLLWRRH